MCFGSAFRRGADLKSCCRMAHRHLEAQHLVRNAFSPSACWSYRQEVNTMLSIEVLPSPKAHKIEFLDVWKLLGNWNSEKGFPTLAGNLLVGTAFSNYLAKGPAFRTDRKDLEQLSAVRNRKTLISISFCFDSMPTCATFTRKKPGASWFKSVQLKKTKGWS